MMQQSAVFPEHITEGALVNIILPQWSAGILCISKPATAVSRPSVPPTGGPELYQSPSVLATGAVRR